jgi:hypothetical protein
MVSKNKTIKDIIPGIEIDLKEVQEDRFALQRMSEKIKELTGDKYVSILFDAKYAPKVGDSITVGGLIAMFRKQK